MTIPVIMLVTSILSLSNEIIKEYHLDSQLDINNHILIGIISLIALIYFIFLIAISLICLAYCIQDSEKEQTNMDLILKVRQLNLKSNTNFLKLCYELCSL